MRASAGHFPELDDEELVLRALLGDLEAFDELVRRFRGAVLAVAEQCVGSRTAAQDVAQESFLLAFKALPQLDDPTRFAAWLCAITRRCAWRWSERDGRSVATEQSELDRLLLACSEELTVHPERELERDAERARIRAALAELPEEFRLVLWLRYWEEWPVQRMSEFLSLPVTTVKWRLHQGRRLLKRRLELEKESDHEREPHPGSGGPAHPAHAPRDRADGQGGQPDALAGERRAHFRAAIQSRPPAPGKAGRAAGGVLRAAAGGCHFR